MHNRYIFYNKLCVDQMWRLVLGCCLLCAMPPIGWAQSSLQEDRVRQYVQDVLFERLAPSHRTHLEIDIQVHGARGAALQTCAQDWRWGPVDTQHWLRIHVPVQCGSQKGSWVATVKAWGPVWILKKDLPQGHVLYSADLQTERRRIAHAHALLMPADVEQMQLRHAMTAGTVLTPSHLEAPVYVKKGDVLEIRATHAGITVAAPGIAPRTGRKGETMKVRNRKSQQWITGTLVAPQVLLADSEQDLPDAVRVELESSD